MKKYLAKKNFRRIYYETQKFKPIYSYFDKKYYDAENENENFVIINKVLFSKKINLTHTYYYLFDYFYTDKEIRNLKLKKLLS